MKKYLFLIPLTLLISIYYFAPNKVYAATPNLFGYTISYREGASYPYTLFLYYYKFENWVNQNLVGNNSDNSFNYIKQVYSRSYTSFEAAENAAYDYIDQHPLSSYDFTDNIGETFSVYNNTQWFYVFSVPYRWSPSNIPIYSPNVDPPEPEPGSDWLGDMWEWFLWQLGINDDYSGDIDAYITGGNRDPFEMVTPSPTPSPSPVPSPTPYSLDIVDNNGNPVYTITGIPGSTYIVNNTTNNNDGSDFDIFEVDLKIGDGGSTNPRDGLNDVMDTSLTYLSDPENVDMQPVGDSFSIIPNDWFLLLGVVACFPFIAGFISKLLK